MMISIMIMRMMRIIQCIRMGVVVSTQMKGAGCPLNDSFNNSNSSIHTRVCRE